MNTITISTNFRRKHNEERWVLRADLRQLQQDVTGTVQYSLSVLVLQYYVTAADVDNWQGREICGEQRLTPKHVDAPTS